MEQLKEEYKPYDEEQDLEEGYDFVSEQDFENESSSISESSPIIQNKTLQTISKNKLAKVSLSEKILVGVLILLLLFFAVLTVQVSTKITRVSENITAIQQNTEMNKETISQLEQEKNELSRAERIKKIAEEAGLTANDDNVRKVGQ